MARIPIRTRVTGALFFIAIACRLEPTEPAPEPITKEQLEYAICPDDTRRGRQPDAEFIKMWCELEDGGLSGPYFESWPSATVRGSLGPQAEGPKVKGWYEHGEKVGDWQYWHPDGGLDRIEHYRPRTPPPPTTLRSACSGLFSLQCSGYLCGIRVGDGYGPRPPP